MKNVMISINPQWRQKIATGEKTIEVRKTKPKLDTPFKCFIYCTSVKNHLNWHEYVETYLNTSRRIDDWNMKVIGEFICDSIIIVDCDSVAPFNLHTNEYIDKECCLDREALWKYTNGNCCFGWHISDLKIYEEPKELSQFRLKHPSQSWCYVGEI